MTEVQKLEQRLAEFRASRETFEQKVERYKQQLKAKQRAASKPSKPARTFHSMNTNAMVQDLWQQFSRAPMLMMVGRQNEKNRAIAVQAMKEYEACNRRLEERLRKLPAGTVKTYGRS